MALNILTDRQVRSLREPGKYPDGGNLYVRVRETGSKSFIVKVTFNRKQREYTLGRYGNGPGEIGLSEARARRDSLMQKIQAGNIPEAIGKSRKIPIVEAIPVSLPQFGAFALEYISQIEVGFRNSKHRAQWRSTLEAYCQSIWTKPVDQVTTADVLGILLPIWTTKPETAGRVRGRIERVLNAAKALKHRSGENPAAFRGHLDTLLPRQGKLQRHFSALPFDELPAFWLRLGNLNTVSAEALKFVILTAARSGEVRLAQWQEIDLMNHRWIVPATRMKNRKEHVVPLSDSAMATLKTMQDIRHSDYVFPGARKDAPLSDMTLSKLAKSIRLGVTVHGFRSTFSDWCGDKTPFNREDVEHCLSHNVGNSVQRAYRRGNAFERRCRIMMAWEAFILTGASPDTIQTLPTQLIAATYR